MNKFAERLAEELKSRGISKNKAAKMIGVSHPSICDWTNNKIQPNAESIYMTCKALDVSADYLLGLVD